MRLTQRRSRTVALLRLLLTLPLLLALSGGAEGKKPAPPTPWTGPVPKADCGPNDRVETGLQGQTTRAERESGASMLAYNCNLELVGQFEGEGASWQFASFKHCGYYDTANNPEQQRLGTVVIDASDPTNPQATAYLDDPAMLDPWESLKVNKKRKLLGATKGPGGGAGDRFFSFYDISDCAHPNLLSVLDVPNHRGHAGDFAPDGMTYYGTSVQVPSHLTAIDIADPTNPKVVFLTTTAQYRFHDVTLSDDGTRLYAAGIGNVAPPFLPNGLVILDVSDIQKRRPNPQIRVISELFWPDGAAAQVPQPIKIKGKPYIVFVDERGAGRAVGPGRDGWAAACAQGLSPFAFARIIDISDERNPKVISKLMLEVHDPANCSLVLDDQTVASFAYDSHYCTVDNPKNAKLVGCGYFASGLRVFDIRDPYHPKEIAYYKPPARGMAFLPGSQLFSRTPDPEHGTPGGGHRTTDWASSNVRFVKHKGDLQIWFTSQDNGFQIVRFTNGVLKGKLKVPKDDDDDDD